MKKYIFLLTTISLIAFIACSHDDDDDGQAIVYDYHAHIQHPESTDYQLGDTLEIEVEFESHTGQPVHHINIQIYNKADHTVVYNEPAEAHVHDISGEYKYEDEFILSAANGLTEGDWVLEATVWGEEEGSEEISEQVEFHLNP